MWLVTRAHAVAEEFAEGALLSKAARLRTGLQGGGDCMKRMPRAPARSGAANLLHCVGAQISKCLRCLQAGQQRGKIQASARRGPSFRLQFCILLNIVHGGLSMRKVGRWGWVQAWIAAKLRPVTLVVGGARLRPSSQIAGRLPASAPLAPGR